jgi:hypothetical protein
MVTAIAVCLELGSIARAGESSQRLQRVKARSLIGRRLETVKRSHPNSVTLKVEIYVFGL